MKNWISKPDGITRLTEPAPERDEKYYLKRIEHHLTFYTVLIILGLLVALFLA